MFVMVGQIRKTTFMNTRAITDPLVVGESTVFFQPFGDVVIGHPALGKCAASAGDRGSIFHGLIVSPCKRRDGYQNATKNVLNRLNYLFLNNFHIC